MKKHTKIIVIAIAVLGIGAASCAQTELMNTEVPVDVSLDVADIFGFKIDTGEYNQNLSPNSEEAAERYGYLHILVSSNRGSDWSIQAECDGIYDQEPEGMEVSSVPLVISTSETATNPLQGITVSDVELINTPTAIYTSGSNERFVKDLLIYSYFNVREDALPLSQGIYKGFIMLTMTGSLP
jgi:hypothetical protein